MNNKQKVVLRSLLYLILLLVSFSDVLAQGWDEPIRGSWVLDEKQSDSTFVLVSNNELVDIVVSSKEKSCVLQAAKFLASDIQKITGQKPNIIDKPVKGKKSIRLVTLGNVAVGKTIQNSKLKGKWEAHHIKNEGSTLWLVGSNSRGTAFAAYTLSERLGIDPLYIWTGYTPQKVKKLAIKKVDHFVDEPIFKYRGLFHDDEDILPNELDDRGYTVFAGGTVDVMWYKRFFETALRLRMNQVAPFVRVKRPYEVRKMASDWGLFYSSHHYDILLSNPFGYNRFDLAKKRGVEGEYDWSNNKEGINKYWKCGLEDNNELDCIWPVGLRGTADNHYTFPEGTSQDEKNKVFAQAIVDQVDMAKKVLPKGVEPIFHFTLYNEMLKAFQAGTLKLPDEVILVWNDNGDGEMRALPKNTRNRKHGVYYHLGFYGRTTKQTHHTITPHRIEEQFRNIVEANATEYMLLNVSDLREHVMNTRFVAEICWDAELAFAKENAADRFVKWWSKEYFGEKASEDVIESYHNYFDIIHSNDQLWQGAMALDRALYLLHFRMAGDHHTKMSAYNREDYRQIQARVACYDEILQLAKKAKTQMSPQQAVFFYENVILGMLIDARPTQAADICYKALLTWPQTDVFPKMKEALDILEDFEVEVKQAERHPFESWYKDTWIRRKDSFTNVHYSYYQLQKFFENYNPRYK
ncbi:glycosyl hydrolase 115 family protein [Labilibacter marinus]|uniref:glycosyl hydrolase 115 family protein n=1 Tax=Labilibacter marinus TaxID=1477105 RepID=UPI0009502B3E|nr:glycosyl hydrolase 115 family protein [Labilibacter marinus]